MSATTNVEKPNECIGCSNAGQQCSGKTSEKAACDRCRIGKKGCVYKYSAEVRLHHEQIARLHQVYVPAVPTADAAIRLSFLEAVSSCNGAIADALKTLASSQETVVETLIVRKLRKNILEQLNRMGNVVEEVANREWTEDESMDKLQQISQKIDTKMQNSLSSAGKSDTATGPNPTSQKTSSMIDRQVASRVSAARSSTAERSTVASTSIVKPEPESPDPPHRPRPKPIPKPSRPRPSASALHNSAETSRLSDKSAGKRRRIELSPSPEPELSSSDS